MQNHILCVSATPSQEARRVRQEHEDALFVRAVLIAFDCHVWVPHCVPQVGEWLVCRQSEPFVFPVAQSFND